MENKKIETFEDLRVWKKGIELVKQIYLVTRQSELSKDFGLRDQLRRASVSIPDALRQGKGERERVKGELTLTFTLYPFPLTQFLIRC
ncbi:MAG: four helix bundle protein [Komarekiella atlantica HA4396-MV6]|nr:four helix bundle protein [Komarekiella atlantica HA4396-MV6]